MESSPEGTFLKRKLVWAARFFIDSRLDILDVRDEKVPPNWIEEWDSVARRTRFKRVHRAKLPTDPRSWETCF